jgi:hypothetical protein
MRAACTIKAMHSELELEISSRFSSRNEFLRVETRRVERHFLLILVISAKGYYRNLRKHETRKKLEFLRFLQFLRFSRFSRVRKTAISETCENETLENFGFFSKISKLRKPDISLRKQKVRKNPSFAGPYVLYY